MALRFRKRIKLFSGLYLNISKTGISVTASTAGASLNLSKKGVKGTVGLPGTGISYTTLIPPKEKEDEQETP